MAEACEFASASDASVIVSTESWYGVDGRISSGSIGMVLGDSGSLNIERNSIDEIGDEELIGEPRIGVAILTSSGSNGVISSGAIVDGVVAVAIETGVEGRDTERGGGKGGKRGRGGRVGMGRAGLRVVTVTSSGGGVKGRPSFASRRCIFFFSH